MDLFSVAAVRVDVDVDWFCSFHRLVHNMRIGSIIVVLSDVYLVEVCVLELLLKFALNFVYVGMVV